MFMEDQDNTQILKDLSDEKFKLLLEEASRGDSLKNTQNSLLKSLNKECQKKEEQEEKAFSGQSRRSRYLSSFKSKNEHTNKKRTDEFCKNKNYSAPIKKDNILHTTPSLSSETVSASLCLHEASEHVTIANHYSSTDASKEMTAVGAKTKGEYEHLDASESVNSSLNSPPEVTQLTSCDSTPEKTDSGIETSSSKLTPVSNASPSGPLDIELQELKAKSNFDYVHSEEDWGTSYNFHHRRKSDGDGSQDYATKLDARIGFPLKKSDPNGTGSRQPLHKSASDFIMRDVSDVINKNLDINENPMKCIRQQHSSRTTSEFMNCSNESSKFDKSSKQNNKKTPKNLLVYKSDEVENFRGDQNVDELINYINMSGKKGESRIYKSLTFLPLESKSKTNDSESKKCIMKETKSSQNKNNLKQNKRHSFENGEKSNCTKEEEKPIPDQGLSNGISKASETYPNKVNADSSAKAALPPISNSTSKSFSEGYYSGLASDFYALSDAASQKVDEGFRVVTKKHRKRRQPKKSDAYRKHTPSSGPSGNTILRDFQQDRRKSTSSMPPSENSSDNSDDADSVYSLPVSSGSAPQPTTRPHTTPSSMSSTPQTSYADITRMSMMHSSFRERPRPFGGGNTTKLSQTSQTVDITNQNEHASFGSFTHKITNNFPRREKYIKPNEVASNNARPIFKNTRENVTQTDPIPNEKLVEVINNSASNKNENQAILEIPPPNSEDQLNKSMENIINNNCNNNNNNKESSKTSSHCSSEECDMVSTKNKLNLKMAKMPTPSKMADISTPVNNILPPSPQPNVKVIFKPPLNKMDGSKTSNLDLPPVIMDEFTCSSFNMDCNISFGFELEELENINLYGCNGAKELNLPMLPKIKNNIKESALLEASGYRSLEKDESSERTNTTPADNLSSPPEVLLVNSGHLKEQGSKRDFEKEAQSYNYHQLVDYFKSKWGSFLQDGSNGGFTYDVKVVRYSSSDC